MADELDLEFGQLTLEVLRKLAAHVVVLEQRIKALEQAANHDEGKWVEVPK